MLQFLLICTIAWLPFTAMAAPQIPVRSEWIKINGGELYCEIAGKGTPIIFLHGYTLDHRLWDPQFFELAKSYQVIRYDLRGFGKSRAMINIPYSHHDDLVSLMDALKIKKAHLVGLSLGANEGVDFLAKYPHRVFSLTAVAGGISPLQSPETASAELRARRHKQRFHQSISSAEKWKKLGLPTYRREWLSNLRSVCGPHRDAIWPKVQRMVEDWPGEQRLTPDYRKHVEPPAFIRLAQSGRPRIPLLVIIGKHDAGSKAACTELVRLHPGAKRVWISQAGHLANLECPKEFNQTLQQFLTSFEINESPSHTEIR